MELTQCGLMLAELMTTGWMVGWLMMLIVVELTEEWLVGACLWQFYKSQGCSAHETQNSVVVHSQDPSSVIAMPSFDLALCSAF